VAKKGANRPIFEGNMPPKKKYPQKWPLYDGHSTKAVNGGRSIEQIFSTREILDAVSSNK
jgi:hypothetical protein